MSDDICNRIEALGYRCERHEDGLPRWVTGPLNHGECCFFSVRCQVGFVGVIDGETVVDFRDGVRYPIAEFEERHRDDKPF